MSSFFDSAFTIKSIRVIFLITASLSFVKLNGQPYFKTDTIKINEVVISAKNLPITASPFKTYKIDSSAIRMKLRFGITDLISENTMISFKSYGPGGSSTISVRGTGASHTPVEWNGININNPMVGQADFSLLPAEIADGLSINIGGNSMKISSGGIGGIIDIETKPDWNKGTRINISQSAGSYGTYSSYVGIRCGSSEFQTNTKAYYHSSLNDFRFLNNEAFSKPMWESMKNNNFNDRGILQEIYYHRLRNSLSARIWYHSTRRNIAGTMLDLQPDAGEKQEDEAFRSMVSYNTQSDKSTFFITGALTENQLNYFNRMASIKSRNHSETVILKAGAERQIMENTKINLSVDEELNSVKSNNYENIISRNNFVFTASSESNLGKRIRSTLLIRETIDRDRFLKPDFFTGIRFRVFDHEDIYLKASLARNSKIPSLNDMYWNPGGNKNLKNEYANQYEIGLELTRDISPVLKLKTEVNLFRNSINDMIIWHPGESSFWTADNIEKAKTSGLESVINIGYKTNRLTLNLNGGYGLTLASSTKAGNYYSTGQLPYIPVNQAKFSINISYANFYSLWNCNFTGSRFTTGDNGIALPGYLIHNILAGIKIKMKGIITNISFDIENLTGTSYQIIAHYPMPGRSYNLKIVFELFK